MLLKFKYIIVIAVMFTMLQGKRGTSVPRNLGENFQRNVNQVQNISFPELGARCSHLLQGYKDLAKNAESVANNILNKISINFYGSSRTLSKALLEECVASKGLVATLENYSRNTSEQGLKAHCNTIIAEYNKLAGSHSNLAESIVRNYSINGMPLTLTLVQECCKNENCLTRKQVSVVKSEIVVDAERLLKTTERLSSDALKKYQPDAFKIFAQLQKEDSKEAFELSRILNERFFIKHSILKLMQTIYESLFFKKDEIERIFKEIEAQYNIVDDFNEFIKDKAKILLHKALPNKDSQYIMNYASDLLEASLINEYIVLQNSLRSDAELLALFNDLMVKYQNPAGQLNNTIEWYIADNFIHYKIRYFTDINFKVLNVQEFNAVLDTLKFLG